MSTITAIAKNGALIGHVIWSGQGQCQAIHERRFSEGRYYAVAGFHPPPPRLSWEAWGNQGAMVVGYLTMGLGVCWVARLAWQGLLWLCTVGGPVGWGARVAAIVLSTLLSGYY